MKKAILLAVSLLTVVSMTPALADDAASSDNKIVAGAKAVGRGIMWGPKKLGQGVVWTFKAMGNGAKKLVGKGG